MLRRLFLVLVAVVAFAAPTVFAQTPDGVAAAAISPDGAKIAMIRVAGDKQMLIIAPTTGEEKPKAIDISDRDVRALYWASNTHVITSFAIPNPEMSAISRPNVRAAFEELRAAFSLNVATMKSVQLLGGQNAGLGLSPRLDRILTVLSPTEALLIAPVWNASVIFEGIREEQRTTTANERQVLQAAQSLWRVNLETGKGEPVEKGNPDTRGWVVTSDGKPLARADMARGGPLEIWSYASGAAKRVYSAPSEAGVFLNGRLGDAASVLLAKMNDDDAQSTSARALDLTTGALGPELAPEGVRIVGVGRDDSGAAIGIFVRPGNAIWLEPRRAALQKTLDGLSPGAVIELRDNSADFHKAIVKVIRDGRAQWFLFEVATNKAEMLGPDAPRQKQVE